MSECRWNCVQDLNGLARLGRIAWAPDDGTTQRGFGIASFRDTYGQPCSVQDSSNIDPRLWVGVDCCRMHLSPAQALGLAQRLLVFAEEFSDHEESEDE